MTGLGSNSEPLRLTGERLSLTPRTDDPTDLQNGQAWIREDNNVGDLIATFRYYDGETTQGIPIYAVNAGNETKALRVLDINGEDGYIPIEQRDSASHPKWSVQTDSGWFGFTGSQIASSVASRPSDNETTSRDTENGLVIEVHTDWPSIGARISDNTSSDTVNAYLRHEDGSLIETVDVSDLTSGDTFTFDDVGLEKDNRYQITVDGDGSNIGFGYSVDGGDDYPFTSDDVDIVDRILDGQIDGGDPIALNDIGNTGF